LIESGFSVDVVEIDPIVVEYAGKFFNLPSGNMTHIGDGRAFIDDIALEKSYDYVLHDVFTGGIVPKGLFSVEALMKIKQILKHDGILALVSICLILEFRRSFIV
jgi:spermidine synthase